MRRRGLGGVLEYHQEVRRGRPALRTRLLGKPEDDFDGNLTTVSASVRGLQAMARKALTTGRVDVDTEADVDAKRSSGVRSPCVPHCARPKIACFCIDHWVSNLFADDEPPGFATIAGRLENRGPPWRDVGTEVAERTAAAETQAISWSPAPSSSPPGVAT